LAGSAEHQASAFSGIAMSNSLHADPQKAGTPSRGTRPSLAGVRLRHHADYQRAYAAGRKRQSASMSWFLAPQTAPAPGPRVGLTAGKVLGPAHERNRIKRRLRESLRRHVELLPLGFDLILHPRRVVLDIEFTKLDAEVLRILQQANTEAARMKSLNSSPNSTPRLRPVAGTPTASAAPQVP
jgi:ribonuclease P protein component